MLDLDKFIKKHITRRGESLFKEDLATNHDKLAQEINGKSALVIGGAGTIGSSYIKALLKFRPSRLYVIDTNENGLTELTRDLRSSAGLNIPDEYKTYPISFGGNIFRKLLAKEGPFEIVANFAAHKHVRSEKDHYSIEAMLQNNILNTKILIDQLLQFPPEHFFCVSTDKAANPVNVMGASKKLMEEVLLAYSGAIPITTARFANVAFSNGSLLAGFLERMMKKQPLSAPSDVKRYFASPEESGQICLLSSLLGKSGEIFFPNLPVDSMQKFSAIAERFLEELGYQPYYAHSEEEARQFAAGWHPAMREYPVQFFTSNTSGEKLYEEFYTETEEVDFERFAQLGVITGSPAKPIAAIEDFIQKMKELFLSDQLDKTALVQFLEDFIPHFQHIETGLSLDQKM